MKDSFGDRVIEVVKSIPEGRVMTYGQIAAIAGSANSARIVGGIAHYGDTDLPWQRVVNKRGGLASGYPGGRRAHKMMLEAENIEFRKSSDQYFVNMEKHLWTPEIK